MAKPYLQDPDLVLYHGDVLETLKELPDLHYQCVVTSPPYLWQRDYGVEGQIGLEPTIDAYVEKMVEVFDEVHRVLRKDGTVWLNLGDGYASNWGQGRKTSWISNKAGEDEGRGWGVETAMEPNRFAHRGKGIKVKDLLMVPARVAIALQDAGWWVRSEIVWAKTNPMPESIHDRPTCAHEKIYMLTKSSSYFYDKEAVKEEAEWERWGTQTNTKYNGEGADKAKAGFIKNRSKKAIYEHVAKVGQAGLTRNMRNVWEMRTEPLPEIHTAAFPQELVERCLKAGTKEGDWVLDPFGGSGTTGLVARKLGRRATLIELNEEYCKIIERRSSQLSLLA